MKKFLVKTMAAMLAVSAVAPGVAHADRWTKIKPAQCKVAIAAAEAAQDVLKPAPSQEVKAAKKDKNVTVVTEGAPEVGKAVAPKTPRRSIKAIPSGSLVFEEGMPSRI